MIATGMDLSIAFGVFTAAANHAECDELAPLREDFFETTVPWLMLHAPIPLSRRAVKAAD
jgi:hypothetical protein